MFLDIVTKFDDMLRVTQPINATANLPHINIADADSKMRHMRHGRTYTHIFQVQTKGRVILPC